MHTHAHLKDPPSSGTVTAASSDVHVPQIVSHRRVSQASSLLSMWRLPPPRAPQNMEESFCVAAAIAKPSLWRRGLKLKWRRDFIFGQKEEGKGKE